MKKLISILLAMSISMSMFIACVGNNKPADVDSTASPTDIATEAPNDVNKESGSSEDVDDVASPNGSHIEIPETPQRGEVETVPEESLQRILSGGKYALNGGEPVTRIWKGVEVDLNGDGGKDIISLGNVRRSSQRHIGMELFINNTPTGYNITYSNAADDTAYENRLYLVSADSKTVTLLVEKDYDKIVTELLKISKYPDGLIGGKSVYIACDAAAYISVREFPIYLHKSDYIKRGFWCSALEGDQVDFDGDGKAEPGIEYRTVDEVIYRYGVYSGDKLIYMCKTLDGIRTYIQMKDGTIRIVSDEEQDSVLTHYYKDGAFYGEYIGYEEELKFGYDSLGTRETVFGE